MAFIDYYKILGVKKDIKQEDLRAAYKKRAKQFHPDLHPNDPKAKAKFQALNEAYDVLSDPEKRKKYDQYAAREASNGAAQAVHPSTASTSVLSRAAVASRRSSNSCSVVAVSSQAVFRRATVSLLPTQAKSTLPFRSMSSRPCSVAISSSS